MDCSLENHAQTIHRGITGMSTLEKSSASCLQWQKEKKFYRHYQTNAISRRKRRSIPLYMAMKERKMTQLGNNFVHGEYMVVEKGRNYSLKDNCALENNLMPTMHHKNVFQPTLSQMSIDMFYQHTNRPFCFLMSLLDLLHSTKNLQQQCIKRHLLSKSIFSLLKKSDN